MADDVSIVEWIIGAVGGAIGAALTAAGFIWRAAKLATEARVTLDQHRRDIDVLNKQIVAIEHDNNRRHGESDERHRENQNSINSLARTLAAQPDKDDIRRLEDKLDRTLEQITRIVSSPRH
jgi:hypothetical protein